MRGLHAGREGQCSGFAGGDADDDGVGGVAGEDFAAVLDAARGERGGGDAGIEIERSPVRDGIPGGRDVDVEIAERLVGVLTNRLAHELLHGEILGFFLLARPEQFADLGEVAAGAFVGVVVGLAGPDGVFVELDALVAVPPKTMAPRRPLPTGRASVQILAGWSYQRVFWEKAGEAAQQSEEYRE